MSIDDYISVVQNALRHPTAQQGLDDLRTALTERAASVGEDTACAEMGDPREYAARLDAEFTPDKGDEFDPPAAGYFLGIPWNVRIDRDWWRRIFNPVDPRLIVPHAFGWGWAINMGAVAVRLGGLRPDDVDEETLSQLKASEAALPLIVAGALASASWVRARRAGDRTYEARATNCVLTIALSAIPTLLSRPVIERIAAQSLGYVILGSCLVPSRHSGKSGIGALVGAGCALAGFMLPLRAAVRRAAETSGTPHEN